MLLKRDLIAEMKRRLYESDLELIATFKALYKGDGGIIAFCRKNGYKYPSLRTILTSPGNMSDMMRQRLDKAVKEALCG